MQVWRRAFATSASRLNRPSPGSAQPSLLRCAQVLQKGSNGSSSLEDQEVQLNGFIRSVRKQKRVAFAQISDGSTVEPVQAFLKPAQAAEYVESPSSHNNATFRRPNMVFSPVLLQEPPLRFRGSGKPVHLARSRVTSCRPRQ